MSFPDMVRQPRVSAAKTIAVGSVAASADQQNLLADNVKTFGGDRKKITLTVQQNRCLVGRVISSNNFVIENVFKFGAKWPNPARLFSNTQVSTPTFVFIEDNKEIVSLAGYLREDFF